MGNAEVCGYIIEVLPSSDFRPDAKPTYEVTNHQRAVERDLLLGRHTRAEEDRRRKQSECSYKIEWMRIGSCGSFRCQRGISKRCCKMCYRQPRGRDVDDAWCLCAKIVGLNMHMRVTNRRL